MKRITVIVGHYGSGKTEFAINYAIRSVHQGYKTALVDLDIANPYFRSRERQSLLEGEGIDVYSNVFQRDITSDLPALDARIRAPLEDPSCYVILDAGGDDSGARILNQYRKYLINKMEVEVLFVVNGNRPETDTAEKAIEHLIRIEEETGLGVDGLVNNTHMLRETTENDVKRGVALTREISKRLGIPILFNCVNQEYLPMELDVTLYPLTLYMRPGWLDR